MSTYASIFAGGPYGIFLNQMSVTGNNQEAEAHKRDEGRASHTKLLSDPPLLVLFSSWPLTRH